MNKLKLGLLISGIISITILSCKKDNNEEPVLTDPVAEGSTIIAGTKKCLLIKLTDGDDYQTYEYDSKNRPVKENYSSKGVADGYQKITFNGSDITLEYYDKNNVKDEVYTFKLGSNGYISSATNVYTSLNGGFTDTETENTTFTYNSEGYLTKRVDTEVITSNNPRFVSSTETDTYTYTYSNGNLVSYEGGSGSNIMTEKYEYYTDKKNNLPSGGDEILNFLLGKRSTNLLKKITHTYGSNNSSKTSNYSYTFNSDGLVSKQTEIRVSKQTGYPDQTNTSNYLFDYNCK